MLYVVQMNCKIIETDIYENNITSTDNLKYRDIDFSINVKNLEKNYK